MVLLSKFRHIILPFLVMFLLIGNTWFCYPQIPQERTEQDKHCFDFAGVLSLKLVEEIDSELRSIKKHFDIDFVCIILPELGQEDSDIVGAAARIFTQWKISHSTKGSKGVLFLISMEEQKVKMEVGYDLEEIYTDLYISQMQNEIFKEMMEQAEWEAAFLASIENLLGRIYTFYNKGIDVKSISSIRTDYLSGGAGATTVFDFGAALKKPLPKLPVEVRQYFNAQSSPELCFGRYLEHLAKNLSDYTLDLFTAESQKFFETHPTSTGQRRSEIEGLDGKDYYVKQKGNYAVVMFTASEKEMMELPVYFVRRSEKGWQMDINTMTRALRCGGPGWVMITDIFHGYSEIIMEEYNLVFGFLKRWDDPGAHKHFFTLGPGLYNENEPGYHIGVWSGDEVKFNLRSGDRIFAVNGIKIKSWKHFWSLFDDAMAGDTYTFNLIRNGKKMDITEKLAGYSDGFKKYRKCLEIPRLWIGVYMAESTDREWQRTLDMRDKGEFRYSSLCSILEVYPGSPADKAGLKPMDLIVDYGEDDDNGEIMAYDIIKLLDKMSPGESIELTILRDLKEKMKIIVTLDKTSNKGFF